MNSMNSILDDIKRNFDLLGSEFPDSRQLAIDIESHEVHSVLSYLKSIGYTQMSLLTCIDLIEESKFELVYILLNWNNGVHIQVRAKISRENPVFRTITNIFPGAQYYERDVHEFFGVEFVGNEMSYKHLFLEMWDDIPPMRKDFDPQAYNDKKFAKRDYDKMYKPVVGGDEE